MIRMKKYWPCMLTRADKSEYVHFELISWPSAVVVNSDKLSSTCTVYELGQLWNLGWCWNSSGTISCCSTTTSIELRRWEVPAEAMCMCEPLSSPFDRVNKSLARCSTAASETMQGRRMLARRDGGMKKENISSLTKLESSCASAWQRHRVRAHYSATTTVEELKVL